MGEVANIRKEIREKGFMSALQIVLRLAGKNPKINKDQVNMILRSLKCKDILKVQYTNTYVGELKFKDLYYYNPSPKPKRPIKKRPTRG